MKVFAVRDKALLGRGIFALFSDAERALRFLERSTGIVKQCAEVAELEMMMENRSIFVPHLIFAAFTYDGLHDSHIFDGLYEDAAVAMEAAGHKGQVVEFVVDSAEG